LLRQLLTESVVLSFAGGLLGLLFGWILTRALPAVAPSGFPRLDAIHIDIGFVLSAALAAVIVGTLSGLFPALRGSRVDLHAIMQAGSGGRSIANVGSRARRALLIVEAALAVVLLVGATLLGRSFERLLGVDGGYDRVDVLTADVHMPPRTGDAAADATAALQFNATVLERVRALPGVRAAGAGSLSPFGAYLSIVGFNLPGVMTADGHEVTAHALQAIVTPGYAEALGLHLEAGRLPRAEDASSPVIAMLVNRTFVKMYLTDGRPIVGRHFLGMFPRLLNRTDADAEIVGIVGDMLPDALEAKPQPEIFLPANRDFLVRQPTFVIKTAGDPLAVVPLLRQIVREANPNAAIDRIVPLADKVADSMGQPRFAALVLASFALLALILAVTGLYAVLAYHVAQRRRELGVRAALGATRRDLLWLVLREGLLVTTIGLACGIALASLLTRAMSSLLFGVTPLDAVAFSAAPLFLLIVATAACLIPARRAATLDPARVLRAD
jgi:putative ABC transport system permease protein